MSEHSEARNTVEWTPERAFREEDRGMLWFHDLLHNNPPITPMGASTYHWPRGTQYAADWISFPYSRGFDFVLFNGRIYPGPVPITNPEEIKDREPLFQEKLNDLIANWPARYEAFVQEWISMLEYLKGIRKEALPLDRLLPVLQDAVRISERSWEMHFQCMYPSIFAYMIFEQVCLKHDISERDMRVFLQGFGTKMYEIDRGLWRLAGLADELGLKNLFVEQEEAGNLLAALDESEKGRVWHDQFRHFLADYGRRTTAAIFDPYYKTWLEDPLPALSTIRTYVLKGGFDFEEHARRIIEERDQFIARTMAGMSDEERAEFAQALQHAQYTYPFNEDHNFYVEQWTYSELRYALLECGRRLVDFGVLAKVEDVFFLTVAELENMLEEIISDRSVGVKMFRFRIPKLVRERRQTWQELHEVQSPIIIGTVPEEKVEDPVFIKIWGFTDDVIRGKARPEEDVADRVEGFPGAPGSVEGYARVIFGYEGFSQVMPDDILVAPFTTPAWTPLFSKIKGVVTDSGGMLAHAAICAREYNIPAVVGTITRGKKVTQVIRTGQRVRLDGSKGVVEILQD